MTGTMDFAIPERVGTTELRRVGPDDDANAGIVGLYADAYTVMDLSDRDKRLRYETRLRETADEPGTVRIAGYREGRLAGVMRWYDYTMNLRGTDVLAGGLGAVAVAFDARRRGVGADLVKGFIAGYRVRGATLTLLHPFRHDFYRRLGFGYGTKMNRYRFSPCELPAGGRSDRVRQAGVEAADEIAACYERVRARTNGLIVTEAEEFKERLEDVNLRAFAYHGDGAVRGYMLTRPFTGEVNNANWNELRVFELIAESPEAFRALTAFLRDLADQFRAIVLETQDDTWNVLLGDPRDASGRVVHPPAYHETNSQGSGVMYRVLDVPRALEAISRNAPPSQGSNWASLRVVDPLIPENAEAFDLSLPGDPPSGAVGLQADIADFSSLAVGSLRVRSLYDYGMVTVSNPDAVSALDRLFAADRAPLCTTRF
jgi:predicted acetyltransferase